MLGKTEVLDLPAPGSLLGRLLRTRVAELLGSGNTLVVLGRQPAQLFAGAGAQQLECLASFLCTAIPQANDALKFDARRFEVFRFPT